MGEAIRHHVAGGHLLQSIVADRRRGSERFIRVAGIQLYTALRGAAGLRCIMAPYTCVAVGLEFYAHGARVRVAIERLAIDRARQILDVVPDFMRDDVRLREIARRLEAALKLVKKTEVEIHALIAGAVERTGGGLRQAAR